MCLIKNVGMHRQYRFKGIVSRDFDGLQMILMDRINVPDVSLEVYSFLNLHLHICLLIFKFTAG